MRFIDNPLQSVDDTLGTDVVAGTDADSGADKKFSLTNLATWLLNKFTMTLGGITRTVKAAIDQNTTDIATLNTDLAKLQYNITSGRIDLSSYTSESDMYVFPYDGYIYASSEKLTTGEIQIIVKAANFVNTAFIYWKIDKSYEIHSLFVKKGTKVYARMLPTGAVLTYTPLTS